MAVTWQWSLDRLIKTIVATLLNKFDVLLAIDGGTGIGKSTLAIAIAIRVKREFKKLMKLDEEKVRYYYEKLNLNEKGIDEEKFLRSLIELKEKKSYNFNFVNGLVYNQKDMQKLLAKWRCIGVCDEAVATMFNRDFYSEGQKNIIKEANLFRDHNNLIIMCIPNFSVMDTQMRSLCKMRITVVKRGLGVIQCPTKSLYTKDHWNMAINEKEEKEWKNVKKPKYSRLTTFRGLLKFPKLSNSIEEKYQLVKNQKRESVLKDDMGIKIEDNEKKDVVDIAVEKLINGCVKNGQFIEGMAVSNNLTSEQLKGRIIRKLKDLGKPTQISHYYWDKKAKRYEEEGIGGILRGKVISK